MNKNILFIHHVSCMAGAERYLLSLIEALDKGYKVFFICQEPGPLTERLVKLGVTVEYIRLGAWRKFAYLTANVSTVKVIVDFCKKHRIDLICSNNYRVSSYAVWPATIVGIPSITIIQDFISRHKLWKFNTFQSDCLITVSQSVASEISKYFPKVVNIYNGIDLTLLKKNRKSTDVLKEEFSTLRGKTIIGMVAHIIPLKGHKFFLKAMRDTAHQFSDVMFVIIGDSPDVKQLSSEDIKAYARTLGIEDRIIFIQARHDVVDLMQSFDILVHPSSREAFGRVIMEAMALAVPVVATRCGGPEEIIEDGKSGFLVPVGDEEQLAKRVKILLNDAEKRKTIGLNGQKRIEECFSLQKTVAQINTVFEEVLKDRN